MKILIKNWFWAMLLPAFGCGQEVKMVEVDPTTISFTKPSQNRKIEAVAKDIHDAPMKAVAFTFSSEDQAVASVDSGGNVKPTGNGSTAIVAKAPNGSQGEAFVKVCLPKELICHPADKLETKVGLAAPIKCHVTDCKDETIRGARIELADFDKSVVLKEGDNVFIGLKEGDTTVTAKSGEIEKKVAVHVAEQTFLPGMEPGAGGGGRRGGGGGGKDDEPYGGGGRFDHILKNMKFKD